MECILFKKVSLLILACVSGFLLSVGATSAAYAASDEVTWSRDCGGSLRGWSGNVAGSDYEASTNYRVQGNCAGNAWVRYMSYNTISGLKGYTSWTNRASVVTQFYNDAANTSFGNGFHKGCGTCAVKETWPR